MYSRHNWKNFLQHVKTPLSQEPKAFSEIFIALLQSTENFAYFEKKDQLHSLSILESIKSEKYGYLHAWKLVF